MTAADEAYDRLHGLDGHTQAPPLCVTCSGRGVWMDEPCADCAPFLCYPCARGDHNEHKLAWVPDIPCECVGCVTA